MPVTCGLRFNQFPTIHLIYDSSLDENLLFAMDVNEDYQEQSLAERSVMINPPPPEQDLATRTSQPSSSNPPRRDTKE